MHFGGTSATCGQFFAKCRQTKYGERCEMAGFATEMLGEAFEAIGTLLGKNFLRGFQDMIFSEWIGHQWFVIGTIGIKWNYRERSGIVWKAF